jgi:hypothetical protein
MDYEKGMKVVSDENPPHKRGLSWENYFFFWLHGPLGLALASLFRVS